VRAAVTLFVALAVLPAQAPSPAAEKVGPDCAERAATHVLVRKDVFVRMDAAEQNLAKAEAALKQAQVDLQAMKAAAEELQHQKALLQEHVGLLDGSLRSCIDSRHEGAGEVVDAVQRAAGAAWEAVDAPLGFAAGAGMCVGIAWGLTQATR
jgi:Skp family chaperone for outer membrane proteins